MLIIKQTTIIQHPQPKPAHAAFLKEFVESSKPDLRSSPLNRFVSEWLQSVGSARNTRCRSDSFLTQLVSEPVPRQLARSAPQMENTRDADGFLIPSSPASARPRSQADIAGASIATGLSSTSSRALGRSLVEGPHYRFLNLNVNNINIRPLREQFPSQIAELVSRMRGDRDSPGPSTEQLSDDAALNALWLGASEPQVEAYFTNKIFPEPRSGGALYYSRRLPMARHTVPNAGSQLKVSNPVPDMLYGYEVQGAFPQQQVQLISMGQEMLANSDGLAYPFFVIEFKGDGSSGSGSLWVATNQCAGGAASCVNIAEQLNRRLKQCKSDKVHLINSAAFSIAMSGTEARLYVTWKHDEVQYYMANVENFLLHRPDHYQEFRKYVRNILDWGENERLAEIRSSLDTLLEESRKGASNAAKSRPPPFDSSEV